MTAFACRSCSGVDVLPVLSLGATPLANALLSRDQLAVPEPRYPLELVLCRSCGLVQITETVPPEALFSDYRYFSSFSDTFLRHASDLVDRLVSERHLGPDSSVIEVASNDGYLLQYYKARGIPVLGIEPAANIAQVAEKERGIPTIAEFFGADLARRLVAQGHRADVIHAHNVLAHVPDLNGFVAGIGALLAPDGVAVIEVPYVKDMVDRCEFDTIYHEHLSYFSLTALDMLFARHGLAVGRVERLTIHGGSLRLMVGHAPVQGEPSVGELLAEEAHWGARSGRFYAAFAGRVRTLLDALRTLLVAARAEGHTIAAYGAAAKGATLLNCLGLPEGTLEFVVDRSPHKQGRYIPGVRLPIVPPSRLEETPPDFLLLLAWNLAEEIVRQQDAYRQAGGRFILPVPEARIL